MFCPFRQAFSDGRIATLAAPRPSQFEAVTEAIDALLAGKGVRGGEK
ncbi:hypothetical protein [uncultured Alistipes sp.]|nr:hypothetical protein [uncultured Alistipes sp.]